MRKGSHKTSILLSFVGFNDAGKMNGPNDGAILTVFRKRRFDQVHLIWNPSEKKGLQFEDIAKYIKEEILSRDYAKKVELHRFECTDVTDHNEIYPKLLNLCKSLGASGTKTFTAAIASGTPAMQVCWILMAESGDFPLELIRSNEPKYGKPPVTPIHLGTGLPRILSLQKENDELKQQTEKLIPRLRISLTKGEVNIDGIIIPLSPIEFSYYRYFAERAKANLGLERFSGIDVPTTFTKKIYEYHETSFFEAEQFRADLKSIIRDGRSLDIATFRGNVSKANSKIRKALSSSPWIDLFQLSIEGKRHAKLYGIRVPSGKIQITK